MAESMRSERESRDRQNLRRAPQDAIPRFVPTHVGESAPLGERERRRRSGGAPTYPADLEPDAVRTAGESMALPSAEEISEMFVQNEIARRQVTDTLRRAIAAVRSSGGRIPPFVDQELSRLKEMLAEGEEHAEAGLAQVIQARSKIERSPKPLPPPKLRDLGRLEQMGAAMEEKVGVCEGLWRLASALQDPHQQAERILELLELDDKRAAERSHAPPPPSSPRRATLEEEAREEERAEEGGEEEDEDRADFRAAEEAYTRVKEQGDGPALEGLCEALGRTRLAERRRAEAVHVRCPGHVTDLANPAAPCPNCPLVGQPLARAQPSVDGTQYPQSAARNSSDVMTPLDPSDPSVAEAFPQLRRRPAP